MILFVTRLASKERRMETSVTRMNWHGVEAWTLANADLSVVMIPAMGAKIVSLLDRRSGVEWLIGPGERPFKPASYGAVFTEQDMSGWDEMFPTIVACAYPGPGPRHGAGLPDHGEVWALPWQVLQAAEGSLSLTVSGRALPYQLTRAADFPAPGALRLRYTLKNTGADPMPYLWAAHPQFLCGTEGQVVLPDEVTQVVNTLSAEWGWGAPETRFEWPAATAPDGNPVRADLVGAPSLKRGRKLFALPEVRPSWAAVLRRGSGAWLRFEWDPQQVPYLGVWVDEGAYNTPSVAAPEPMTAWYDDLALAYGNGHVPTLAPGQTDTWTLTVCLGSDRQPHP
jgi:galactose mutarotase-like enzyme